MKESLFQMKTQRILSIDYQVNPIFSSNEKEIIATFSGESKTTFTGKNSAVVQLTMKVFSKEEYDGNRAPFYVVMVSEGVFIWNDKIPIELVSKLLNSNAPAVLLSFQRSILSQLTAFSNLPAFVLPLLNFSDEKNAAADSSKADDK